MIPIPHDRPEADQISIEHYFTDEEIKTELNGKRLFIHENYDFIPVRPNMILQLHRDLYKFNNPGFGGNYKNSDNIIAEEQPDGTKLVRFQPVPAWETPEAVETLCNRFNDALNDPDMDPLLLMQPIENSAKLSQNPSKSVKFHPKIRTRLELSNFGGWRAASPTAFIRIFGYKTGLQPVLIHPTANLGDRTKMNVLFLNNHSKLCFSSLIYTAVYHKLISKL